MKDKNTIIIALLIIILGLLVVYVFGYGSMNRGFFMMGGNQGDYASHMHSDHSHDDDNHDDIGTEYMDGSMQHAMSDMMLGFNNISGQEYEEAFLRGMIVHHVGAVRMAERLLEETDRPELVALANDIISSQTAEIKQMREWLQDWFNNN